MIRTEKEIRSKLQYLIGEMEEEAHKDPQSMETSQLFQAIATLYWTLDEQIPRNYKFNPGK